MLDSLKYDVVRLVSSVEIQTEEDVNAVEEQRRAEQVSKMSLQHGNYADEHDEEASSSQTYRRQEKKIGRNDPCPCGSGKKYKACHGSLA